MLPGTAAQSFVERPTWAFAASMLAGVPALSVQSGRTFADICDVTGDFRDQYYGLVGAVGDDVDGPPLADDTDRSELIRAIESPADGG